MYDANPVNPLPPEHVFIHVTERSSTTRLIDATSERWQVDMTASILRYGTTAEEGATRGKALKIQVVDDDRFVFLMSEHRLGSEFSSLTEDEQFERIV